MNALQAALGCGMLSLLLLGVGCQRQNDPPSQGTIEPPLITSSSATILVSTEPTTKYCNGEAMDREGYRKTITALRTTEVPPLQTETERAKSILLAATTGMCRQVIEASALSIEDGALHIPPVDGWAGISITMCSCVPQVEVNALRLPGVTRVVWETR